MRISVATKIFSIAAVVIVAMAIVSLISLLSARNVGLGIQRVTSGYLTIYGGISRVNVYSTEEAYRTRQYITEKALGLHHAGSDFDSSVARLRVLDGLVKRNLAEARQTTARELANPDPLIDKATLARIDERLDRIETQESTHLQRQVALMQALQDGDMGAFQDRFDDLTKWRADYDSYIDQTRLMVFRAGQDAGRQVAAAQRRAMVFSVTLLALACALAIGAALLLSRQLVRPLTDLLSGIHAISAGRLEVEVPVKTQDEIGRLTEAFNEMTHELRVGTRARELFGRYVDPRIAGRLIEAPATLGEEGVRRTMTVMFCDLQGFTAMSERMTPRGLVAIMNRHFTLMSEVVRENAGIIDKFIGDAVMAYWGPPFVADSEHARLAVASAISQVDRMARLQAELPDLVSTKQDLPALKIRIGIATGEVLVGSIGSDVMRAYTVMGDAVNVAARLESANKLYGTQVLVTEATARQLGRDVLAREIDSLIVLGRTEPVRAFEIVGPMSRASKAEIKAAEAYEAALQAYRQGDWTAARSGFAGVLALTPDDPASQLFLQRIDTLSRNPPKAWDGVWVMQTK